MIFIRFLALFLAFVLAGTAPASRHHPQPTPTPTATPAPSATPIPGAGLTMAWIYPGAPACNAPAEYHTQGIDVLKPEYYTVEANGTLRQVTVSQDGCNGFSTSNAADIKAYSQQQYFTVSTDGGYAGLVALWSSASLISQFVSTSLAFLASTGFTGEEIDFENFDQWTANDWANYQAFLTTLGTALHADGYKLMVDGPAITDASDQAFYEWHWEAFNALPVDYAVVEAYDYMYATSAGQPVTPLSWLTAIDSWMLAKITDPTRIVIGIPSFGYHGRGQNITIDTYTQSQALPGFTTATRDPASDEMTWKRGSTSYFYSDQTTLDDDRVAIDAAGLANISVWHLGGNLWF